MKIFLFAIFILPFSVLSQVTVDSYAAYLIENGFSYDDANQIVNEDREVVLRLYGNDVSVRKWEVPGVEKPVMEDLLTGSELTSFLAPFKIDKEQARQTAKPLEQKQYENKFFQLIEALYNETGVTNTVTPKIGFPEIEDLIETVQATDPMAAVNYSLKLLSIDAALKRYNTLWWDDAIQHALPE